MFWSTRLAQFHRKNEFSKIFFLYFETFYFYLGVDQYQEAYLTATETVPVTDVRLPTHAIPEKYVIHLTPFIIPDNFTIEGHVSIDIDVNKDANNITLHIKGQENFRTKLWCF